MPSINDRKLTNYWYKLRRTLPNVGEETTEPTERLVVDIDDLTIVKPKKPVKGEKEA